MAGPEDPLTALRPALAALDDGALASLASVGLLRRARKDLEGGEPVALVEPASVPLALTVGDCTVRIPAAGPAAATCTCPAPGVCRHILAAVLFLQRRFAEEPVEEAATSDVYTLEEIARWAGRKTFREALRLLAVAPTVEVDGATVRFPDYGVECRHLPGAGLDGTITNAPLRVRRRFIAASALAWQRSAHGLTWENEESAPESLREPAGAPRTRVQVIAEARSLFAEMLTVGLSHLSDAFAQRLATLGVSALGANLPRLSRVLRGLAGEVELLPRRDARADEARIFLALADAEALCAAMAATTPPPPALVGEHRTRYEPAGSLELTGLGAWAWRTRSGFGGLTVLFWSPATRRWLTWSESRLRRVGAPDFSPAVRYRAAGPWTGLANPREASRTRFTLRGAKRNSEDRLSAAESSQAAPHGPSRPGEIDFGERAFDRFADLRRYAASVYPMGLAERRAGDEIVVVRPAVWGARGFDPILQSFRWVLWDAEGSALRLEIPYDETGRPVIEALESLDPEKDGILGLIGRLVYDGAGLSLSPAVLLRDRDPEIVSLGLDPFKGSAQPGRDRSNPPATEPLPPWLARTERDLAHLEERLLALAEAGRRAFGAATDDLAAMAPDLEARGLANFAAALRDLPGDDAGLPARLSRLRYLCQLHRQAARRMAIGGT